MERNCSTCKWTNEDVRRGRHCGPCFGNTKWEPREVNTSTIKYNSMATTNTIKIPDDTFTVMVPSAIKNVIFNDPTTIVFWSDGTKTVVKCQDGEPYDAEKGLAMAISKKAFGNKGNYCNVFKKWLPEEEEVDSKEIKFAFDGAALEREYKKALDIIQNFVSNCSAEKDE